MTAPRSTENDRQSRDSVRCGLLHHGQLHETSKEVRSDRSSMARLDICGVHTLWTTGSALLRVVGSIILFTTGPVVGGYGKSLNQLSPSPHRSLIQHRLTFTAPMASMASLVLKGLVGFVALLGEIDKVIL